MDIKINAWLYSELRGYTDCSFYNGKAYSISPYKEKLRVYKSNAGNSARDKQPKRQTQKQPDKAEQSNNGAI